jgi:hypothetical protein
MVGVCWKSDGYASRSEGVLWEDGGRIFGGKVMKEYEVGR